MFDTKPSMMPVLQVFTVLSKKYPHQQQGQYLEHFILGLLVGREPKKVYKRAGAWLGSTLVRLTC